MFQLLEEFLKTKVLEDYQSIALSITNFNRKIEYKFNDAEAFYPASLIKLFAAFYAVEKLKNTKLEDFAFNDLNVAIRNSLEESDNDALSLVYDFISGSASGLYDQKSFIGFTKARNSITEYFHGLEFSDELALHNKCYSFAPYGKDLKLFLKQGSNKVLISDIEKIMDLIINKRPELLEFMIRSGECEQSEFIYKGLNEEKLDFFYSKAGWTTSVRHDVAYFSYNKEKYLFVILTKGLSEDKELIPSLSSLIFS